MSNRFKNTLYTLGDYKHVGGHIRYVTNDDGTLFSGHYHKRFEYMSTKGITDMVYLPSRFSNHYLKDDCLLISYSGKITAVKSDARYVDEYEGWDDWVWGNEIVTILRGARKYSGSDIELKWKKEYMQTEFPDPFDPNRWNSIDVDELFSED